MGYKLFWGVKHLEEHMNIFIEYEKMIKDFMDTFVDVNEYRKSLSFSSSVDEAIKLFENNQYNRQTIVDHALKIIEKERNPYDKKSILVGNVSDFLEEHFSPDEIGEIIGRLESIITSDSERKYKRDRLLNSIKIEESKVFLRFHQILAKKLREEMSKIATTKTTKSSCKTVRTNNASSRYGSSKEYVHRDSSTGKFTAAKTGRVVKSSPVEPRLGRELIQTAVKSYVSRKD